MGIYSKNTLVTENADVLDITIESAEESVYESSIEGAYAIVAENEMNYNTLMQAIGIHELNVLEETGTEMIYEAADIKGFFAKIKKFLLAILAKIAQLFKKFFAMVDGLVKSDKDFVAKYTKELMAKTKFDGFEYKGYKFTHVNENTWKPDTIDTKEANDIENDATKSNMSDAEIKELREAVSNMNDKFEDIVDAVRGDLLGSNSGIDAADFAKEIHQYFRDGQDSKVTLDGFSNAEINKQLGYIKNTAEMKKTAEKTFKEFKKVVDEQIKKFDKLETAIAKTAPDKTGEAGVKLSAVSVVNRLAKSYLNAATQVNGGLLTALKDQNRQARAICVKALTYTVKEGFEHYQEGADDTGSFFDNVQFN